MLQRKPVNRLGYNGISEIKEHPWLKYYPWKDLFEKKLEAPFVPKNIDNFDKKYCEGPDKIGNDTLERYQNYYKKEALNEIFMNYSFENMLSVPTNKIDNLSKKAQISNHNTYLNNINNTNKSKRINSSVANINNISKGSLNNLLKNKMKITESLYLNNSNNQSANLQVAKQTPIKHRNNSQNILYNSNLNTNNIYSPNHIRNLSSNSNFSNVINSGAIAHNNLNSNINNNNTNKLISNNTPNKSLSINNLTMLKSRSKNLSMNNNSSNNLNNIISNVNNSNNNNNLNINNYSSAVFNLKQSSITPYKNIEKIGSDRLPFIEQKLLNSRQFSSNIGLPKKVINSPIINKSGIINPSGNVSVNHVNQIKGNKYTTLSANSTGSSTLSLNFLHRRSGSTNTFNNY